METEKTEQNANNDRNSSETRAGTKELQKQRSLCGRIRPVYKTSFLIEEALYGDTDGTAPICARRVHGSFSLDLVRAGIVLSGAVAVCALLAAVFRSEN